jgi:hypothetical protein
MSGHQKQLNTTSHMGQPGQPSAPEQALAQRNDADLDSIDVVDRFCDLDNTSSLTVDTDGFGSSARNGQDTGSIESLLHSSFDIFDAIEGLCREPLARPS